MIESEEVQDWREKFLKVKSKTIEEYFIDPEELIYNYKNFNQVLDSLKETIKQ